MNEIAAESLPVIWADKESSTVETKQIYGDEEVEQIIKERDSKEEAYNKCYFDYRYWKDKAKEYKHRAEVAERALKNALNNDTCYFCNEKNPCRCEHRDWGSDECIKSLLQQAEKELAEGKKVKYRGKHAINDHRWYYGDVIYHMNAAYIIGQSFDKGEYFSVKVIPTTVVKCIDHVDVNGVDIYEGDIINILQYDTYASEQAEQYEAFYAVETKHGFLAKLTKSNYSRVEVVGNKWDNPELLELCKAVI